MLIDSIASLCILAGSVVLVYFGLTWKKYRRQTPKIELPATRGMNRDSFDGPFAPHATSSLSMMNELYRQHRLAHSLQRDQQVLAQLKTHMENAGRESLAGVGIKCKFGRVTLSGRAHSPEEKAEAERIARSVYGVIDVSNQIVVVATQKAG